MMEQRKNRDLVKLPFFDPVIMVEYGSLTNDERDCVDHLDEVDWATKEQAALIENLPADYEECGDCGYDHAYEPMESALAHAALDAHDNKEEG